MEPNHNSRAPSPGRFLRAGTPRHRPVALMVVAAVVATLFVRGAPVQADNARDIKVTFTNTSDFALDLIESDLPDGCWNLGSPPSAVEIGATVTISSRSCGVLTGTEFTVKYGLRNSGGASMRMRYNNPYAGSDEFSEAVPTGFLIPASGPIEDRLVTFACDSATCDGIPDDWKRNGVTIDPAGPAGPQFVDLPQMGVELDRPNVLVHLDWMDDGVGRSQQLRQAAIDEVIRAYDRVPVTYRGATRPGINLVVDHGPTSTIEPGGAMWGSLSRASAIPWTQGLLTGWREPGYDKKNVLDLVRNRLIPTGRLPIFTYGVAAAWMTPSRKNAGGAVEFDNTSGFANPFWMIVSLGGWTGGVGSAAEQTGTFMHEFGHVMSLSHGGQDDDGYKPNYPSVMNYLFQTVGVPNSGAAVWDYTRIDTPNFDERNATEAAGVSLGAGAGGLGTGHRCPDGAGDFNSIVVAPLAPVDWSCSRDTGGVGFDVNGDGVQTDLKGSTSDWSRMRFKRGAIGRGPNPEASVPAGGITPASTELTVEQARKIAPLDLVAPVTSLTPAPAANTDGWNRTKVTLTFTATDNASGVAWTEASIDGAGYELVSGPIELSDEGVHTVAYRSSDYAQNVEAPKSATIRIDRTKPLTVGTSTPQPNAAGWNNGPTTVSVLASDALSGVRSTTVSSSGALVIAPRTTPGAAESVLVSVDGITTVTHHATDRAENVGDDVSTTVKVDATPPSSSVDQRLRGATVIHRGEFVSGTAADATSGIARVIVTYTPLSNANGAVVTVVTATLTCGAGALVCTWTSSRPPHPGPWLVSAVATDVAGNVQPVPSTGRVVITG